MIIDQHIINFVNNLANISSKAIKKYYRQNIGEVQKDNQTPVTKADREAEQLIRDAIIKEFPDHGIIGEEFEDVNSDAKYKWIIDPIDGTISFVIGRPIFGTLIALICENKPILGMINQPITNERWIGIAGDKTIFNNQQIQSRKCSDISQAILCSTSPFFFKGKNLEILNKIAAKTKYQTQGGIIYGGDCYSYGLLALGQIDIIIERGLNNFDFMALAPIIESAGGVITDWEGKDLNINSDGTILACGSKELHQQVLDIIRSI